MQIESMLRIKRMIKFNVYQYTVLSNILLIRAIVNLKIEVDWNLRYTLEDVIN